jgi:hypothetical protein
VEAAPKHHSGRIIGIAGVPGAGSVVNIPVEKEIHVV